MTAYIKVLLDVNCSIEQYEEAASNLINIYDLPLTDSIILYAFYSSRNYALVDNSWNILLFLYETLLLTNKNMFIAVVLFSNKGWCVSEFVTLDGLHIGHNFDLPNVITLSYEILLSHYNFDVDDLAIPKKCKIALEEYRVEIYSGALSKQAY